jgi:YcxB-like protein
MASLSYEYDLTAELWTSAQKAVTRRIWWLRYLPLFMLLLPLVIVAVSVLSGRSLREALITDSADIVLFPLLGFVVLPWQNKRAIPKRLRSNPALGGLQTISFTDEGITLKAQAAASSVQWPVLLRIVETPQYFLFYTLPNQTFFLPVASISPSDLPAVRGYIAAHATSPTELAA